MTDIDAPRLAAWVRSKHAKGKHALVLVDGYDPAAVTSMLMAEFPSAVETSKVDFMINDLWVLVRVLLSQMPSALIKDPRIAVCTISPE